MFIVLGWPIHLSFIVIPFLTVSFIRLFFLLRTVIVYFIPILHNSISVSKYANTNRLLVEMLISIIYACER
jgi:hypothetical protein